MLVHNLKDVSIPSLVNIFNLAFEGYFIPIVLTEQQLLDKIKSENIKLDYSVGISVNNSLVAFILIGIDTKNNQTISYNAGTGVLPDYRGQNATRKMYDFLTLIFKNKNIQNHYLEVITQNAKAIKIYESVGYRIYKTVSCFKGIFNPTLNKTPFEIKEFNIEYEEEIKHWWNHFPTYQNTISTINRNKTLHKTLGAFDNQKLIGYIIYVPQTGRIKQFAVNQKYRRKNIASHLFYEAQKENPTIEVSLINIDNNDLVTICFLNKNGLKPFLNQFEMKM